MSSFPVFHFLFCDGAGALPPVPWKPHTVPQRASTNPDSKKAGGFPAWPAYMKIPEKNLFRYCHSLPVGKNRNRQQIPYTEDSVAAKSNTPPQSSGVFDPRGILQLAVQARPLVSLLAGIKIRTRNKAVIRLRFQVRSIYLRILPQAKINMTSTSFLFILSLGTEACQGKTAVKHNAFRDTLLRQLPLRLSSSGYRDNQ